MTNDSEFVLVAENASEAPCNVPTRLKLQYRIKAVVARHVRAPAWDRAHLTESLCWSMNQLLRLSDSHVLCSKITYENAFAFCNFPIAARFANFPKCLRQSRSAR